jgi:hypothetical protein
MELRLDPLQEPGTKKGTSDDVPFFVPGSRRHQPQEVQELHPPEEEGWILESTLNPVCG